MLALLRLIGISNFRFAMQEKFKTKETFVLASVKEFVKLWGSGSQATFNLECSNGQAWFQLGARLGPPAFPHFYPHRPSPERKRKKCPARIEKDRARAAEHRAKQTEEVAAPAAASKSPPPSPAATVDGGAILPPPTPAVPAGSPPPSPPHVGNSPPPAAVPASKTFGPPPPYPLPSFQPDASAGNLLQPAAAGSAVQPSPPAQLSAAVAAVETDAIPPDPEPHSDDIIVVHATAVFEDSPSRTLLQDDYNSLQKFILHQDHLEKNICHLESSHVSTRELRSCAFKHTLDVKIHVKCANLWEPAKTYIWKHLGKEDYKRSNGTLIKLVKIHVKQ